MSVCFLIMFFTFRLLAASTVVSSGNMATNQIIAAVKSPSGQQPQADSLQAVLVQALQTNVRLIFA